MTESHSRMHLLEVVRRTTVEERQARGRQAREHRPRTSIATFSPAAERPDPVALLASQETVRRQLLLPLRHSRMAANAFSFYRGSAIIMANDLGAMPSTQLVVQLCGDAHLSNFGLYGAPDRSVVFDINDFDETNPGPFEWDVLRLATSFVLAGRQNGLSASTSAKAARTAAREYRQQISAFAGTSDLDTWYSRIDVDTLSTWASEFDSRKGAKAIDKGVESARERTGWTALAKTTEMVDGHRRWLRQPPLLIPVDIDSDGAQALIRLMDSYRETLARDRQLLLHRYHVIDLAHKVVGVGSVGLLAFVLLMEGRDAGDVIALQAKQAVTSVLEPFTGASELQSSSLRVVAGQQLMQAASDVFLGHATTTVGRDYYVRQLRDMKFAPDPSALDAGSLPGYAVFCGRALARAHARAGDAVAIDAYLGTSDKFDQAVEAFSTAYADQVEADFRRYTQAIAAGEVNATMVGDVADYRVVSTPTGIDIIDPMVPSSPASRG